MQTKCRLYHLYYSNFFLVCGIITEKVSIMESHNEYIYVIFIIIGFLLIAYATKIHFDAYDSMFIPIKAIITNVDCVRHIINRRRDDYHCQITIEYELRGRVIENYLQTHGGKIYYVGDQILIFVDKDNPVDMYVPYMSHTLLTLILTIIGILIILMTLGARFFKVK